MESRGCFAIVGAIATVIGLIVDIIALVQLVGGGPVAVTLPILDIAVTREGLGFLSIALAFFGGAAASILTEGNTIATGIVVVPLALFGLILLGMFPGF